MEKRRRYIMTKAELKDRIAEETGFTKVDTDKFYKSLEENINGALEEGDDEIRLGFATIKVKNRDAYTGRNPSTGEDLEIPSKNVGRISLSAPTKRAIAQ